jgi:type II restriction enzyme
MITGNKGEWSELYAFFKLLADGKIYGADENINLVKEVCYVIIKILREESGDHYEYLVNQNISVVDSDSGQEVIKISSEEFKRNAALLLSKIRSQKASTGAFSIPVIEEFMEKVKVKHPSAPVSKKADIRLMIHDPAKSNPLLGFSIKSQLGANSTLLNAGGDSTNFIFEVMGKKFSKKEIDRINSIDTQTKIKDRLAKIESMGGTFTFYDLASPTFRSNLEIIDTNFPNIISEVIYDYYLHKTKGMADLIKHLEKDNPCKIKNHIKSQFYQIKIKNFLAAIALGMVPGKIWDNSYDVSGGYIIVKENGDLVCYHLFNFEKFKEYLVNYTYLETPSSTRHNFGKLYELGGKFFFNLNLQIRFR